MFCRPRFPRFSARRARGNASRRSFGPIPYRRRLRIEPLEDRRLLSITVDTLVDENNGMGMGAGTSLREAILAAAANETIDFYVMGTIQMSLGSFPLINKNLTINGPGADLLTVRAYDPTPDTKNGDGHRIFFIGDNNGANLLDVAISGLTLSGADVSFDGGGAIWTSENLIVSDCVIVNNRAGSGGTQFPGGGAIQSIPVGGQFPLANSLTLRNCIISGNSAPNTEGGAIRKRYGTLLIEDCTITDNSAFWAGGAVSAADGGVNVQIHRSNIRDNRTTYPNSGYGNGGGIFVLFGSLSVTDSTITENAAQRGGGVFANAANVLLSDTIVSNNSATGITAAGGGAGIWAQSNSVSINRCTISGNTSVGWQGGGINAAYVSVIDSTISGNSAAQGGGIWCRGGQIINSTLSSNTATTSGGAISGSIGSGLSLDLRSSTITANISLSTSPGAVRVIGGSHDVLVSSSIIAGNTNGDVEVVGSTNPYWSLGYNLIGTGNATPTFGQTGDQTGVTNPMLGPLADNGGPTRTHALLAGSPAIDTGDPTAMAGVSNTPLYDQRGVPFTRVYDGDAVAGARIDIGAFELQPLPAAFFGDYNGDGSADAADYVVWRKALGTTGAGAYWGADGDGDGTVDDDDYDAWTAHFGQTLPPGAGSGTGEEQVASNSSFGRDAERSARAVRGWETRAQQSGVVEFGIADFGTQRVPGVGESGEPRGPASQAPQSREPEQLIAGARRWDDALMAWLSSQPVGQQDDDGCGVIAPREDSVWAAANVNQDSLDAVFDLLAV